MLQLKNEHSKWNSIYKMGGYAALSAVLVGVLEIVITFLPGGNTTQNTVLDWFMLFQTNPFLGLRDMGLLNILLNTLAIPIYFALYIAHKEGRQESHAALAAILALLGIGVFFATNRAFPMLALSRQYVTAVTAAQRAMLKAAGQSMLSVGASHTPGTFLGFFLVEAAGVLISIAMLRSKIFSNVTAFAGMLGFGILMAFEFFSSFVSGLSVATMIFAMFGGILSMVWYILIARRLFQLGQTLQVEQR
jgi:hypothetical protein